jgi:hypothetical protein
MIYVSRMLSGSVGERGAKKIRSGDPRSNSGHDRSKIGVSRCISTDNSLLG